jgi:hypothetical protein
MNLPFHVCAPALFGVLPTSYRELTQIVAFPVVCVDSKSRDLAFHPTLYVLVATRRDGDVAWIARSLRADEVTIGAVANASDPDARVNSASVDLGKMDRSWGSRRSSRRTSH